MLWPGATLTGRVCGLLLSLIAVAEARATPLPETSPAAPAAAGTLFEAELAGEATRLAATRGRPEGVVPLLAVAALYDEVPPGLVERLLRETADARGTDPLVAAQAAYLLARIEDDRAGDGNGDAGANESAAFAPGAAAPAPPATPGDRRRAALGFVTRFAVVGPFGDGRASFGEAFPPEHEDGPLDPARRYPGKEREVWWRSAAGVVRQGVLYLDGLLRPDSQTAAYATTFIHVDRGGPAALRLGSPGPTKVWVNGALAHARDVVRGAELDQDAIGVVLRRGWNRVLVKTVVVEGPWRLLLRITDPSGRPLPFTQDERLPDGVHAGPAAGPHRAPSASVRSLDEALRRRAERAPPGLAGADAWLDRGRFLAWNQPGDREARAESAALEAAVARRPTARALLLLAEVARDEDERRRTLERAREAAAGEVGADAALRALVLSRLGDVARDLHRDAVALGRWREAIATDARCWPASLAIAEEEQSAGLPYLALGELEALPARAREIPRVKRQLAGLLDSVDRHAEADRLMGELAAARHRDVEVAHDLARRARARGDAATAIELLRRSAAVRPDSAGADRRFRARPRGGGAHRRGARRAGGPGRPAAGRGVGARAAGEAAAPAGRARGGADPPAPGAGAAAAGSGAAPLHRAGRRRPRSRRGLRARGSRAPLRRRRGGDGRGGGAGRVGRGRGGGADRRRAGAAARRSGAGAARPPGGARSPQRPGRDLRAAGGPRRHRSRRRGQQAVLRALHPGGRRGRDPPGPHLSPRRRRPRADPRRGRARRRGSVRAVVRPLLR